MNAFEIKGLTKRYDGFALENVDLVLPEGCILGLIGENGAGKTTTLKAALNIIPKDGGEVEIFGQKVEGDIASLKEDIGIVMGEPGLSSCLTGEQVTRIMEGIFARWDDAEFRRIADELDLPLKKQYKELSQGNRMKMGIAVALSHGAKMLILDEPTNGLDPVIRDKFMGMLMEFTREENHSVLLSSHIVSDLEKVCDYIAFLHDGKLMLCEEKDALMEEYGVLHCKREDFEAIDPAAVIGSSDSIYGVSAVVRRDAVPEGWELSPVNLEDLFVVMVKGA
ncbi:MAG: ABC transporter ATP-binding protein [Firmicutes bacterium]|nr:ABC transporter ATP-binding protein [Bacillota bacterium]